MTKFDYIVLGLLAISAVVGFARGAAREVLAMIALLGAAAAALLGLRFAAPAAGHFVHPRWLAATAALIGLFAGAYLVLRLVGAGLARRIHGADVLGALDRTLGLLIGLARGLVVLGALYLMFTAATPVDLQPRWIVGARTWPLAGDIGGLLKSLAPKGLNAAARFRPMLDHAVGEPSGDRSATEGYDARERGGINDDLVEKSR